MFKNYQELLLGYAEFYRNSFYPIDEKPLACGLAAPSLCLRGPIRDSFTNQIYQNESDTISSSTKAISGLEKIRNFLLKAQEDMTSVASGPRLGSKRIDENGTEIIIGSFNGIQAMDVICISLIFGALVASKRYLTGKLKKSNYLDSFQLKSKDRERLEECVWRLLFYIFSSIWLLYSCFIKHTAQKFFDPNNHLPEYSFSVDWEEYGIIMIETAFYLHATYAIIFEDVLRRDTPMMFVHHLAAISGVVSVYATRTHRIGLAAVVLRDTCDVLLEVTKLTMCFRVQNGRVVRTIEHVVKLSFVIFAIAFAVNQLYYYPLFCLYHGFNVIKMYQLNSHLLVWILTCGLVFLLLDLLWFLLILRLLWRMLWPSVSLKDLREFEDDNGSQTTRASGDLAARKQD